MKSIIISSTLIIIIIAFAFTSSALVSNYLDTLSEEVEAYKDSDEETKSIIYRAMYDDYKRREVWLCILIDDESLIKIEEDFIDIITQTNADKDESVISINRLICHLEQIRRLSGFNIKSIL